MRRTRPPYTGYTGIKSDGQAIERLVTLCARRWKSRSLGTYANRDKIGKHGQKSVHADYRAADIEFPTPEARKQAMQTLSGLYGIELIVDYAYTGTRLRPAWGRGWRCDRGRWQPYRKGVLAQGGMKWAQWLHVEVSPDCDPDRLEAAFRLTRQRGTNGANG